MPCAPLDQRHEKLCEDVKDSLVGRPQRPVRHLRQRRRQPARLGEGWHVGDASKISVKL